MRIDLKNAQELDPNKTYLFCFDVGDTPKEKVLAVVEQIKARLKEKNIEQVIYMPIFKNGPKLTIESIDEKTLNKTLKQFLEEKFEVAE